MNEAFELRHVPHTVHQVRTCTTAQRGHAVHRELTGLVLYSCNCGYSSGWVDAQSLPTPSIWLRDHMPSGATSWTGEGAPDE